MDRDRVLRVKTNRNRTRRIEVDYKEGKINREIEVEG